jgi:hypothetical protein
MLSSRRYIWVFYGYCSIRGKKHETCGILTGKQTFGNRWIGRGGPILPPPLNSIGFLSLGYMQNLVYKTPVERQPDLVGGIAVAAGTIREMPGIFQRVQHNIARRCRTCSEVGGRHFEQLL